MTTFGEMVEQRKLEVLQSIEKMSALLAKEERIFAELNNMLRDMSPAVYNSVLSSEQLDRVKPTKSSGPRGMIKRLVLEALKSEPNGLDALGILAKINQLAAKPYLRTSLSPQLSRLKEDGYIMLEGKIWKLKKIEPLDANPSKEPSKGSDTTLAKDREAGSGGGP